MTRIMASNSCILPFDVLGIIIDELASSEDISSIKACCLASKTFVHLCRKRLFSSIKLCQRYRGSPRNSRIHRLKRILPSVAPYIRQLKFSNDKYDQASLFSSSTIFRNRRLTRVTSFYMGFTDHRTLYEEAKPWTSFPYALKSALCAFFQANAIVQLCFFNIEMLPIGIFTLFPSLDYLDLYDVSFVDAKLPTRRGVAGPPRIKTLWLRRSLGGMQTILAPERVANGPVLDLSGLEIFFVLIDDHEPKEVVRRILALSGSLKDVTLGGSSPELNCDRIADNLTAESLRTLKKITLCPSLEYRTDDPYANIIGEFERISGRNVLEELIIDVNINADCKCTVDYAAWDQLDDFLSTGGFPLLRKVELNIRIAYLSSNYVKLQAQLEDIGRQRFGWLRRTEAVEFGFKVEAEEI